MTKAEIHEKVASLVAEQLGLESSTVTLEKAFVEDLGADSIAVVELMITLEESFGVTIDEDKAPDMKTVDDIVSYISKSL